MEIVGMEGKVVAMSKIKTIVIIILILFMGAANLYLGMLDAKMDYQIMCDLQEHLDQSQERNVMEDWIDQEYGKSDWWMEQGVPGGWRYDTSDY